QVREVKALIKADYDAAPSEVKGVFLLGHVAVPYSGNLNAISGLHPDHTGAHPADMFYGDVTAGYGLGGWSDSLVDNSHALTDHSYDVMDTPDHPDVVLGHWLGKEERKQIRNIPGDGKFDLNVLPHPAALYVGRVDLYQ